MEQRLEREEGGAVGSLRKRVRQWEWPVQRPKVGGQEQQGSPGGRVEEVIRAQPEVRYGGARARRASGLL